MGLNRKELIELVEKHDAELITLKNLFNDLKPFILKLIDNHKELFER